MFSHLTTLTQSTTTGRGPHHYNNTPPPTSTRSHPPSSLSLSSLNLWPLSSILKTRPLSPRRAGGEASRESGRSSSQFTRVNSTSPPPSHSRPQNHQSTPWLTPVIKFHDSIVLFHIKLPVSFWMAALRESMPIRRSRRRRRQGSQSKRRSCAAQ